MFKITTTGTSATVRLPDLGGLSFAHPTVDFDLETKCTTLELARSIDLQAAINAGTITATDEDNNPITDVDAAGPLTGAEVAALISAAVTAHNIATGSHPIGKVIHVGTTADNVDFTSIAAALTSIDNSDPDDHFVIQVNPGIYIEDNSVAAIELKNRVDIVSVSPVVNSVTIRALDSTKDLFHSPGNVLMHGLAFENVHNGKAAVRIDGPVLGITALFQCGFYNVDVGVDVYDGNYVLVNSVGITISVPDNHIGTLIRAEADCIVLGLGMFVTVPSEILLYYAAYAPWVDGVYAPYSLVTTPGGPGGTFIEWIAPAGAGPGDVPGVSAAWGGFNAAGAYVPGSPFYLRALDTAVATNPVETVFDLDGAQLFHSAGNFELARNTNTAAILRATNGTQATCLSWRAINSGIVVDFTPNGGGYVGDPTLVNLLATVLDNNYRNAQFTELTARLSIDGVVDALNVDPTSGVDISGQVVYRDTGRAALLGLTDYQYLNGDKLDLGLFFHLNSSTGLRGDADTLQNRVTGTGGLGLSVAASSGILKPEPDETITIIPWATTPLLAIDESTSYVIVDGTGIPSVTAGVPNPLSTIVLAKVIAFGGAVQYIHNVSRPVTSLASRLWDYLATAHNIVYKSGLVTTESATPDQISITAGRWYVSLRELAFVGLVNADLRYYYNTDDDTMVRADVKKVDITQYDLAGVLTALSAGKFKSETVYVTNDGQVVVVMSTAQFDTQDDAIAAAIAAAPPDAEDTACVVASLIVEEAVGLVAIVDRRPRVGASGSGSVGGGSAHGDLTGLAGDDHVQYLLTNGSRAMSGALNMGTFNITNVGTVDGVTVSNHKARHQPGGADAIPTAAAVTIGTANTEGAAATLSRSNHVHDHGNQTTATHHAVATGAANGFQSAADKAQMDGIVGNYVFSYSLVAKTLPVANTFEDVSPEVNGLIAGIAHATIPASSLFTIATTGIYEITYTLTLSRTSNPSATGEGRLVKNGVEIPGSAILIPLPTTNETRTITRTVIVSLAATDLIRMQFTGTTTAVQVTPQAGNASQPSATIAIRRIA